MKKVLAWVLLLTLVLGAFAGCKNKPEPEVTEPTYTGAGAADAIEYLKGFYTDSGKKTPVDFTRFGIVRVGGVAFDVVWTVDVSEDLVKIVPNEDGTVTVDINEACEADTEYTLTATVTDAQGNTASYSWTYVLPEGVDMVEVVKSAYALQPGESLPYESRLIGKIISIDAIWTDEYQNVTVTIEVEGAEDMPIKCYRMKANDATIDAAKNLLVGNIITVCGTLKNYEGTIEFDAGCILEKVEKGDAIEAPTDPGQILKEAYALPQDATLPYQATLTGTVTSIDSPYDPQYGNISVVITVEGYERYPMLCYRLKGTGVDQIAINDLITVTGIIKNYRGTIEYDAGCVMTNRVSGGGVAQGPSSDPNKIIPDALKLAPGEKMAYRATLTGEVVSVDTPYDPGYGNVTVTMKVQGYKFQCYRMVGDGIDQIRETDTITVSGVIENYNGKLEFGAKCTLDSWVKGPRPVGYGPLKEDTAYRLYVDQKGIGKVLYFNGDYSGSRLSTSDKGSEGVDVFVERVSGKGVYFYFMEGQAKKYISVEDYTNDKGQVRGRTCVVDTPNVHWAYNSDLGVYLAEVSAGKHFMGAYNTYETISASWVGYIDGSMASSNQYVAKFMAASDVPADGPSQGGSTGEMVTEPEVGVPYKWGIEQENKGKTMYFTGAMSGYYGATSENIEEGVDVMLEAADGGYYITFKDASGAKKYVTVVVEAKDGKTYRNFTIANAPSTVYTYNTEYNTLVTNVDGDDCYMGTYDNFVTFSVSYFSKIDSSFPSHFYTVGEGGEVEPEEPTQPSTGTTEMVTEPEVGVAYKWGIEQKNKGKTMYFTGAMSGYYGATSENIEEGVDVMLEAADGGYYITFKDASGAKKYITVVVEAKDGKTYRNFTIANAPSTVYTYNSEYNTMVTNVDGDDCYMGTYDNFVTFSVSYFSKIDSSFPSHFYTVGEGGEVEPEEPTQPSTGTTEMVEEPEVGVAYKWGIEQDTLGKTLYFNGEMAKTYYGGTTENIGEAVDVMLEAADGGYYLTFKDASGAKKYITVVVSVNGTKTYRNFTIADKASTVYTWDAENNTLTTDVEGTICYMGTYSNFDTFSVSTIDKIGTSFPAHFYTVGEGGEVEPEVTEPTTPDVTEPSTGDGFNKITSADQFTSGKYVMIVDTGYAPGVLDGKWVSAVQPVVSGSQVTDTKDAVWTLTVKGNSVVITDANGASIAPSGGNSNGITSGSYDWTWTFKNGKFVFAGTGSDTVSLASNANVTGQNPGNHRFRAYKNTTVSGQPDIYPNQFTLYKLSGEYVEPEVTEPTTPDVTEPSGGEAGMVTAPEVGVAYKWGMEQNTLGKTLYFNGEMAKTYYGGTTENIAEAVDVMLEAADGGYYLTFKDASGAKKYITVVVSVNGTKTYRNFTIADKASTVYTWDAENNTLTTDVEGTICYIGTYSNFDTFSISTIDKIGTSFPSHFYTVGEGGEVEPEVTEPTAPDVTEPSGGEAGMVTAPEVGVAYKWGIEQDTLGKTLYFNGEMAKTYYGGTTENIGEAVDVMLEAADGGYYLTFKDASGAKKYITVVVSVNGTKTYRNFTIADKASTVYTWDAENNTLTTDVEGTICYIGTYSNFDTFSISTIDKIGTSFPSHFYTVGEGGEVEPEVTEPETTEPEETEPEVTEPVTGTGYVKVTDASQLTSGKYVLVVDGGYAPSTYASGWINVVQPVVSGNQVTDTKGAVWTLTVSGNTVTITDSNGVTIAPVGGNKNGITNSSYAWAWTFQNGKFVFTGTGSDTVTLASNGNNTGSNPGNFRFRAYKNTTVSGQADVYPSQFTLYKLVG